jgi:hypothetical protein
MRLVARRCQVNLRSFGAAGLIFAASGGVLWYAAVRSEAERCSAEGPGGLPFLAMAGMLAAVLLAFAAVREAYGLWSIPAALLFGAAALGLLCSGWLALLGPAAFASGCV